MELGKGGHCPIERPGLPICLVRAQTIPNAPYWDAEAGSQSCVAMISLTPPLPIRGALRKGPTLVPGYA